jgi:four helix bundle protein
MGKAAAAFEELHIYQRSRELTNAVYTITRTPEFNAISVSPTRYAGQPFPSCQTFAEDFERGSKIEFIQFLYIAKGSCGEVRAQLQIARDQQYFGAEEYHRLFELCRLISGMISNFIAHLQKTDYQGEKTQPPQATGTKK